MSNILVTGAGGYIGSHVVKKLLKSGHQVVAFDNFSRGYREPLERISKYGTLRVVEGDLRVKSDVENAWREEKIDIVIHLAALCVVDESVRNPEIYMKNNVVGTVNLLEVMKEHKSEKIIFSSTCAVYGNAKYLPINEEHPTVPGNPYGQSKLLSEQEINNFSKNSPLKYVIFRYFNVTGADSEGELGDSKKPSFLLVQNAVRGALGIEPFIFTSPEVDTRDGTPVRDYVDVEDVADAHIKAIKYLESGEESVILNLGNGVGWSVVEILEVVRKKLGLDFGVNKSPIPRRGEYKEVYADIKKAGLVLGWHPRKTLEDSVESLRAWYKNVPEGYKQ